MSFIELLTVLFEVFLYFVHDNGVSNILPPNYLLYGRNLNRENKIVEEIDFGVIEGSDLWERKCAFQNVVEHFWSIWYQGYLDGLREQSR